MKNVFSLMIALCFVTIISCTRSTKDDCKPDPDLENLALISATVNQNITRAQLSQLSLDSQFVIFNSLSHENKKRIFNEKYELLKTTENFTSAELAHIQLLQDYPAADLYSETPQSDAWIANWENTAISTFGWSGETMFTRFNTWMMPYEFPSNGLGEGTTCNCRYTIGCDFFGGETCNSGCTGDVFGCGISGRSRCTGRCW